MASSLTRKTCWWTGDLCRCKISVLPRSFSPLVCTGDLNLANQLQSVPADFGQLKVAGSLYVYDNQLQCLPADFQLMVAGDLLLSDNQSSAFSPCKRIGHLEGGGCLKVGAELTLDNNHAYG